MEIPAQYRGRYFYHFTHIDNIPSIIEHGGLLSTNKKKRLGIEHHNIANQTIQGRRSEMPVPVGYKGVVHDYVPFYFASTNIMLLSLLNQKLVDQPYICVIAVSIERLLEEGAVFTSASANTDIPPKFYYDPENLKELNWDLIDSKKWGVSDSVEKHARMAEALLFDKVPLEWFESFVVFNDIGKDQIIRAYKQYGIKSPPIAYYWFHDRAFFFTKFFFKKCGREDETLVTGPIQLKKKCDGLIESVIKARKEAPACNPTFMNVGEALSTIQEDFAVLPELQGILGLETDNTVHEQTVSDHTILVVENLECSYFWKKLDDKSRNIVRLAAYFHDIGKGPKDKWENGIQKAYADHPADAIPMLRRILTEEFDILQERDIRRICILVVYHDLMGDIISNGRSIQELIDLDLTEKELYMLASLTEADVRAIKKEWVFGYPRKLERIIHDVQEAESR